MFNGFIKILAAALATSLACNVNSTTISLEKTQTANTDTSLELTIHHPQYYQGTIHTDHLNTQIYITDTQGNKVQQLLYAGEKEAEVHWFIQQTGHYTIHLTTTDDQSQFRLHLDSLPLKTDQTVDPKAKLSSPLLIKTAQQIEQRIPGAETRFWQHIARHGTPLIEPHGEHTSLVTFLWHGQADNVGILGSPYGGHGAMSHLKHSQIWYQSYEIPNDSRFSYRLAPNIPQLKTPTMMAQRRAVLATTQPDPLNPRPHFAIQDHKFGAASTIALPHAPSDHITRVQSHPAGSLSTYTLHSDILNSHRQVTIYQPNQQYPTSKSSPVLILFDGNDYLTKVPTPTILDNLIAEHRIPPMYAVFVNTAEPSLRAQELTPNPAYAEFMAKELHPWLCQQHQICPPASQTILSGSSFGGLASMYIAMSYPDQFGAVLSQSGSFWWGPKHQPREWLLRQFEQRPHLPIRIYMNAGLFETHSAFANILDVNRQFYHLLKHKGYQVAFREVAGGHDYFSWRVMLADGLSHLFAMPSS